MINTIIQIWYFGFYQTFQPKKFVDDDIHRNLLITNEWLKLELNPRNCKHGGPLLEAVVELICQWIQAHGRSGMSKN